jgi:hypothetical protein
MLGEAKEHFSLTRAAPRTRERGKSDSLSISVYRAEGS